MSHLMEKIRPKVGDGHWALGKDVTRGDLKAGGTSGSSSVTAPAAVLAGCSQCAAVRSVTGYE